MTPEPLPAVDSRNALAAVITALERRGLKVVRSFDLRSALTTGAGCPDHGTGSCQCQYVVLLVYGPGQAAGQPPATVTFHRRATTWLEIGRAADAQPNTAGTELILAALADISQPEGRGQAADAAHRSE